MLVPSMKLLVWEQIKVLTGLVKQANIITEQLSVAGRGKILQSQVNELVLLINCVAEPDFCKVNQPYVSISTDSTLSPVV